MGDEQADLKERFGSARNVVAVLKLSQNVAGICLASVPAFDEKPRFRGR